MSPSVDILILSWNRVEDTIAAIQSAHQQQGVEKSILIVDQGSEPASLARLREYLRDIPEAVLFESGVNLGVGGGRNKTASLGRAPYLVALDSDAEFADTHSVARAVGYLESRPDLCALGFRITNFFTRENDATSWDYPGQSSTHSGFQTTRFVGAGHAIRRSSFEAVGGYDERLFFCGEEWDLCYRMINSGSRVEYYPAAEVLHKVSPEHRVFWARGRFFYTTRNGLYSTFKFGASAGVLIAAAAAYALRGIRNGMPLVGVRATIAAIGMCRQFSASSEDKSHYRLTPETIAYIRHCEPTRGESVYHKLRRQFSRLPHQV